MRMLSLLRELFRKFPRLLLGNIGLLLLSGTLESLTLLTMVPIVDLFSSPGLAGAGRVTQKIILCVRFFGVEPTLLRLLVVLVFLQMLAGACSIWANHSTFRTKYAVLRDFLIGSFDDFFAARWFFFSNGSQGTLLNTFTREVSLAGDAFGNLAFFFAALTRAVFYLIVPMVISWRITLFGVAMVSVLVWPFLLLGKAAYRLGKLNTSTANETMRVLQESLAGAKVILGFGNQSKSRAALDEAVSNHTKATIKSQTLSSSIPSAYKACGFTVMALTLLMARHMGVPLSGAAVFLLCFLQIISLTGQLASNKNVVENLLSSYEQVKALRQEARRLEHRSGGKPFMGFDRELVLERVTFAYPGRPAVLKDISLRLRKGGFLAVVGESGAGKSTLIDLIMAFHEPSAGRIALDGTSLGDFDVRSYRRRIGYVPQESFLFNTSIRENLLWAVDGASEDDLRAACRRANAAEFIDPLPQGYDTLVGDRGVRLSGGQVQRLALARAMLRKPALLILDEATSSLDTQSEKLIQGAIESIARETTIIAIAHRLSTVMNADHIVLLRDGVIAEEGSYASLSSGDGLFRRMVRLQTLQSSPEGGDAGGRDA